MMNRVQLRHRRAARFASQNTRSLGLQFITALGRAMHGVLNADRSRTIIVGVNPITRLFAQELRAMGNQLSVVSLKSDAVPDDETMPFVNHVHPATSDEIVLTRAGAHSARCLLAASADDDRNLSLCRTAIDKFHVSVAVARLRLRDGITTWVRVDAGGLSRMSWSDLIHALAPETSLTPALSRVAKVDDREHIAEIEVRTPLSLGRRIADLSLSNCEVLALTRNGNRVGDLTAAELCMNDVLTLIGTKANLRTIRESLASL